MKSIYFPRVYEYIIRDAVVHPPFGIITIGEYVLEETLAYVPFRLLGYSQTEDQLTFPCADVCTQIDNALHVMGVNYSNYFHWIL